ncbi:hypothetical protein HMPREF9278_0140, partial [Mobiluncus mulieris FB024-16]
MLVAGVYRSRENLLKSSVFWAYFVHFVPIPVHRPVRRGFL